MPKTEQKQVVIDEIKSKLENANSIVLVDYRGLKVGEDTELRKTMRESGVEYKVYKNTMMSFAFNGTEFEDLKQHLAGPTAIAISYEDPTAGPRSLNKIAKKYSALEFKAGVVEGKYYDVVGITKIAAIPPKDELLAKLLGSLNSPIASFARVVKAVADKKQKMEKNNIH